MKVGEGGYGWGVGGYKSKRLAGLCVWGSVAAEQRWCRPVLTRICRNRKKDTGRTAPLGLATSKVRRVKNVSASGAPSRCAERSSLEQGPAGPGVCRRWRVGAMACVWLSLRTFRAAQVQGSALAKRAREWSDRCSWMARWTEVPCSSGRFLRRSPHSRCCWWTCSFVGEPDKGLQICSKILAAGPAVKVGERNTIGHGAAVVALVRLSVETGRT